MSQSNNIDQVESSLLNQLVDMTDIKDAGGAYNLRKNGQGVERFSTKDIQITPKTDKPGIDITIAPGLKNGIVHIPVLITEAGVKDKVYNDFFIGEGADVLIMAGCGIHNDGYNTSEHVGIHSFYIGKDARVKYVEKHYGEGAGTGEKILHPETIVNMGENSYAEFDMVQIRGVDSTNRTTTAELGAGARFVINEKLLTDGKQSAVSDVEVKLQGADSTVQIVSRSVAKGESTQVFYPRVIGEAECKAHVQCDSIIMDDARVRSIPEIAAYHRDAQLVHEAAIGKIAGDQILKLMTLGLTEGEAEERILKGFLK
jgi:Fe-S cluster assembly scaffold protein SufB